MTLVPWTLLVIALGALVGCRGGQLDVELPQRHGHNNNSTRSPSATTPSDPVTLPPGTPGLSEVCDARPITPPQPYTWVRLTREQYLYTLEDVLGVRPQLRGTFEDGRVDATFVSNVAKSVTEQQALSYEMAASEAATLATASVDDLVGCQLDEAVKATRAECRDRFFEDLAPKLFRRPLTSREHSLLLDYYTGFLDEKEHYSFSDRLRMVLEVMLQSPQFLYRAEFAQPDGSLDAFGLASRLSYLLWHSAPDDELLARAADGSLLRDDVYRDQLARMLTDTRLSRSVVAFYSQWLHIDELQSIAANTELARDARRESELFVDGLVRQERLTLDELWRGNQAHVNRVMAEHYGLGEQYADGWREVELDPRQRGGLLRRAAFLGAFDNEIRRGEFMLEEVFCQSNVDFPNDLQNEIDAFNASTDERNLNPREIATERLAYGPECAQCHARFDPMGYGFFHYDDAGRWLTTYGAAEDPVDASGVLPYGASQGPFDDIDGLLERVSASPEAASCQVQHWLQRVFEADDIDACLREELTADFLASQGDVIALLRAIALRPEFKAAGR